MQLPERSAIELRHMQYRRSDTKLSQYICKREEHTGDFGYTEIGGREEPGHRKHRSPRKSLSRPFGSGSPGETTGEPRIQIALILEFIWSHRSQGPKRFRAVTEKGA